MKKNPAFFRDRGHFRNRENHPGLVIGPHDADNGGFVGQAFFVERKIDGAVVSDRQQSRLVLVACQGIDIFTEVFYCRVLHPCGDDMPFLRKGLKRRQNCGRVTFRAAAGKDKFIGLGADKTGYLFTRLVNRPADHAAECMHARRISIVVGKIGQHGFKHLGINPGGGIVVHINDLVHPFTSSTTRDSRTSSLNFFSTYSFRVV